MSVNLMSRAIASVAPTNLECHPERSEGSLCPTSQTLRCAQGDNRQCLFHTHGVQMLRQTLRCAQGDNRRQAARGCRSGKFASVDACGASPSVYLSAIEND